MDRDAPHGLSVRLRQAAPIPLDVAFDVGAGEVMALVGVSGSGKTTTLRAIAGLHRPAEAKIAVNGVLWADSGAGQWLPARQRRVGLVFQSYALFPHLSGLQNVMEAMTGAPQAERMARASALLAAVHLDGLESRLPHQLSGGQQQRVALARALARQPDVLLLDEPFSALDRPTRRSLKALLKEIRAQLTMPVVLVTHDVTDIVSLATRVCVIDGGRTVQEGPLDEVLARPATAAVRDLLSLGEEGQA